MTAARVMTPRFPLRGSVSRCQWCGIVVFDGRAGRILRGAGALETVVCSAPFAVHLCDGEKVDTFPCWACSDECERKLLALNGLPPDLAGFAGAPPSKDVEVYGRDSLAAIDVTEKKRAVAAAGGYPCPRCGATPGMPCRARSRNIVATHTERIVAAAAALRGDTASGVQS